MILPDYWFDSVGKTQRPTVAVTAGSVAVSYVDNLINIAARIVVGAGGERNGSDRMNTQSAYRLYFQGNPDITAKDRFVFNNRVFDIASVNNFDEAGVYLRCDATEVQPSGVGA